MPRNSERGGPETRARIASTASGLFVERGFDAVTVAEVARHAGVSSVTVFKHFPRKEDLFLDRSDEALAMVRDAVTDRTEDADVLDALQALCARMLDDGHPFSGTSERSRSFFATVAGSPTLRARARELAAELQDALAGALRADASFHGDAELLAAFFVAGYAAVYVESALRVVASEAHERVVTAQRHRLDELFAALRSGVRAA